MTLTESVNALELLDIDQQQVLVQQIEELKNSLSGVVEGIQTQFDQSMEDLVTNLDASKQWLLEFEQMLNSSTLFEDCEKLNELMEMCEVSSI